MTAIIAAVPQSLIATYVRPQLEKVPIDQVLTNLAKQSAAKPDDAKLKFNLARAYAMAYASKADEVQLKGEAIWYGYQANNVPFTTIATTDKAKQARAKKNLSKALETYESALKLAPDDIVGRLGYAWSLDQAGKKDAAVVEYRKVIAAAWKNDAKVKIAGQAPLITEEAAGYLIPLLDKSQDAPEINNLKGRIAKMQRIGRWVTPIAIPLADRLRASDIEDHEASVAFDADGSAVKNNRWTWIKPNAAWLVFDKQNSGKVDSALQMFGNVTFWMFWDNGYEPLTALDDDSDGQLRGTELAGLFLWHDANKNGVSERGEVRPLAAHGIVAISCSHQIDSTHPHRIEFSPHGVTYADGATRPTFDLLLHRRDVVDRTTAYGNHGHL